MKLRNIFFAIVFFAAFSSCKKFLGKIPDKSLATPATLDDFQQLLDNDIISGQSSPVVGDISSDDMYLTYTQWQSAYPTMKNAYVWVSDVFEGRAVPDWDNPYKVVYYSNLVLDGLKDYNITSINKAQYDFITGSAFFYRGFSFFNLAQIFAKPYVSSSAANELGIPLRLTSDLNIPSVRATLQQTYDQAISDITQATKLLPVNIQIQNRNRPSKPAAFALLSRVYLSMNNYVKAKEYADSCLNLYNVLIDYKNFNASTTFPFQYPANDEVMYRCGEVYYNLTFFPTDTTLYKSYDANDLRKSLFFQTGLTDFRGNYTANILLFNGLATDEIYLTRAECIARAGDPTNALNDLNTLLVKRWKTGTFTPVTASSATEALNKILTERRKELLFRGIRWMDLRRLNQDPTYAVTLKRILNGQTYTLPPNDPKYTFPIPEYEIRMSGIQQNQR